MSGLAGGASHASSTTAAKVLRIRPRRGSIVANESRPATGCRSPAEYRYKKSNKYFMREIL